MQTTDRGKSQTITLMEPNGHNNHRKCNGTPKQTDTPSINYSSKPGGADKQKKR